MPLFESAIEGIAISVVEGAIVLSPLLLQKANRLKLQVLQLDRNN